eukprot:158687-Chlamydomonas_euryale.AAC.1
MLEGLAHSSSQHSRPSTMQSHDKDNKNQIPRPVLALFLPRCDPDPLPSAHKSNCEQCGLVPLPVCPGRSLNGTCATFLTLSERTFLTACAPLDLWFSV